MPHRIEIPRPHLARGSYGSADFRRILDQLDSKRNLAALARMLVAVERGRSFFKAIHGIRRVQVPAHVGGGDDSVGSDHVRGANTAQTLDR